MIPIVDLHCDLLEYLAQDPARSPNDRAVPCCIPFLIEGGVKLQTLAVFTMTEPGSVASGQRQLNALKSLKLTPNAPQFAWAIENASGFCTEDEPLAKAIQRLYNNIECHGVPLYVSLTWNSANRFGGGNCSDLGLKPDGRELLHLLNENGIAVDLSHTCDRLAYDILDEAEREGLTLPILASHSNARSVCKAPRNLPDDLVKEISRRKGLIGLNLFSGFVGGDWTCLAAHVERLLELGAEDALCFGADFFHLSAVPKERLLQYPNGRPFFREAEDARCYPAVLELVQQRIGLDDALLHKIAHGNALNFSNLKTFKL